jgi:hypothetical protein
MEPRQITDTVLMVRPAAFGYNPETAPSNPFQQPAEAGEGQPEALAEFERVVETLLRHGIRVEVAEDTPEPRKTDAVFPNNWISTHQNGTLVIYPMQAPSRRAERRTDIIEQLKQSFALRDLLDLSAYEQEGLFLEGTGSLVLDRVHRLAYACLSPRTSERLVRLFCKRMAFEPIFFQARDVEGRSIYHTNVIMTVGEGFGACCFEAMQPGERKWIAHRLMETGHAIIELSMEQLYAFAGNLLQMKNEQGVRYILLSESARRSLGPSEQSALERQGALLSMAIPTIERLGGGSLRCMLAELFLQPV